MRIEEHPEADINPYCAIHPIVPFPLTEIFDAFISYGRLDSKAFAFQLHDQLTAAGYRAICNLTAKSAKIIGAERPK